jgi:hypothetical protein
VHRSVVNEHGIAIFGHEDIATLAYTLWQGRGGPDGFTGGRLVPCRTRIAGPRRSSPEVNARPTESESMNAPISRPSRCGRCSAPPSACSGGGPSVPNCRREKIAVRKRVTTDTGSLGPSVAPCHGASFGYFPLSSGPNVGPRT